MLKSNMKKRSRDWHHSVILEEEVEEEKQQPFLRRHCHSSKIWHVELSVGVSPKL